MTTNLVYVCKILPLKHKIVASADEAEKQYAIDQAFYLKDEGLSIINSNRIAQIKKPIIDCVHCWEEHRELFSFEEYESERNETVDKANCDVHHLTWKNQKGKKDCLMIDATFVYIINIEWCMDEL